MKLSAAGTYGHRIDRYFLYAHPIKEDELPFGKKSISEDSRRVRPRVLVVDDEDLIADSVTEILNRNGYDAIATYSGKAAIEHIQTQCPDILVSDVIMPELNGIQLATAIRLRCPEARILLFSGNAATSELLQGASNEGQSFELLAKPVHPMQLLNALKS